MKYNIKRQTYGESTVIQLDPAKYPLNSIYVLNLGTTTITVNGEPLLPGEWLADNGNENDILVTRYEINVPTAGVSSFLVRTKILVI